MSLIASLDIGSEKMVMAVATQGDRDEYRLTGIKMIVSQGVKNGIVEDWARVKSYVQFLMKELVKDQRIGTLKVALSGRALQLKEQKVSVPILKREVMNGDLVRAEGRCVEYFSSKESEIIDILPMAYAVDRGDFVIEPQGIKGRNLEAFYRVYIADSVYVAKLKAMFGELGIDDVSFFPESRAYLEAFGDSIADKNLAVVDMGAMSTKVVMFRRGVLKNEVVLPLGSRMIEVDIMSVAAFKQDDLQKAKKLKHEHGEALRSQCKAEKIDLPEVKLRIDKRDLSKVVQCRLEELLEGVVFQLQQWGFNRDSDEILLTGGGSRVNNTDKLLGRLSGHRVGVAKARGIHTTNEEILSSPTCFVALGLLQCEHVEQEEEDKSGIGGWFSNIFK